MGLEQELIGLPNILAVLRSRHQDAAFRPLPNPVTTVLAHSRQNRPFGSLEIDEEIQPRSALETRLGSGPLWNGHSARVNTKISHCVARLVDNLLEKRYPV